MTDLAVDKGDGNLHDLEPGLQGAIRGLNLKGVTVGGHMLGSEALKRVSRERLEACGHVASIHAQDESRVQRSPQRQRPPPGSPAFDGSTGNAPASQNHVGPSVERVRESANVTRIVGEIRVELDEAVVASLEPLSVSCNVGPTQTWTSFSHKQSDSGVGLRSGPHQLRRSVTRLVIDDENVGLRDRFPNGLQTSDDVLALVERGDQNESPPHVTTPG